jgi:type II secretory pathway pseudopilin PulG
MMQSFGAAATNEFPESIELTEANQQRLDQQFNHGWGRLAIFSRLLLPSIAKAVQKNAAMTAQLRCARAALKIEEYRINHGRLLPSALRDISPISPDLHQNFSQSVERTTARLRSASPPGLSSTRASTAK